VREVLLHLVRPPVEELVLVHGAVRRPLARGAVVGAVEDERVLELSRLLQVVDDPADLRVGVLGEPANTSAVRAKVLLVVGERVPGADVSSGE
jgi:hypothetical protein